MSFCYDFEKWTIISLASVAVSLTIGPLLEYAYGYVDGNNNGKDDVKEYWNSSGMNKTTWEGQVQRYNNCMHWHETWNGSSCILKEPIK